MNSKDATDRYESLLQLTPAQALAVEVLDAGGTHQVAADTAGVNRVTVSRWVHHHPAFVAEMNRRQIERADRVASRAGDVTIRALEVVAEAINEGDASVAIQWLRISGSATMSSSDRGPNPQLALTAESIIDRATESAAMSAPIDMLAGAYRQPTVEAIHHTLGES